MGSSMFRIQGIAPTPPIGTTNRCSSTRENFPGRTTPLALMTLVTI